MQTAFHKSIMLSVFDLNIKAEKSKASVLFDHLKQVIYKPGFAGVFLWNSCSQTEICCPHGTTVPIKLKIQCLVNGCPLCFGRMKNSPCVYMSDHGRFAKKYWKMSPKQVQQSVMSRMIRFLMNIKHFIIMNYFAREWILPFIRHYFDKNIFFQKYYR